MVSEGRQRQAVVRCGQGVACCGWARFRQTHVAGFDFGKMVFDVTKKADGASGAAVGPPLAIGMQGASFVMGLLTIAMHDMLVQRSGWVWEWCNRLCPLWWMSCPLLFLRLRGITCRSRARPWSQVQDF